MMEKRVTQKDLARALGLARSTVTMALRHDPSIPKVRRDEVLRKAAEMGYQPDPMLSALSQYRKRKAPTSKHAVIAWLNVWPEPKKLRAWVEFDHYWLGAAACAEEYGYRLEEFVVGGKMTLPRLEEILLTRNIQGILVAPHRAFPVDWNDFNLERFFVVGFGGRVDNLRFHLVGSAQAINGVTAFTRLRQLGYRRIAFVGGREQNMFGAGFQWAQKDVPAKEQVSPFFIEWPGIEAHQTEFTAWLKKGKPDAIFTEVGCLERMIAVAGYRVPDDIGLATTTVLDTPIDAGIDQNSREVGRTAMLAAISLINDNDRGIPQICRHLLVEGRWVDGKTLPRKTKG
jgi:LacI family transcriptional regulator